jgi:hypothetical protein
MEHTEDVWVEHRLDGWYLVRQDQERGPYDAAPRPEGDRVEEPLVGLALVKAIRIRETWRAGTQPIVVVHTYRQHGDGPREYAESHFWEGRIDGS